MGKPWEHYGITMENYRKTMGKHGITVENQSVVPHQNNSKCWIPSIINIYTYHIYIYIYVFIYIYIYTCRGMEDCMYKPPKCFKGITFENCRKTMGKPWDNCGKP